MPMHTIPTIANLEILSACPQQGCNSQAFLGRDPQLNAPVFIKVIHKRILDINNYFSEAQILYASQHPNVMEIRFASETNDFVFFVMDYCELGSLQKMCENRHLTCREVIKYSLQFLNGLHSVHTKGFIHFDIKPSNILIAKNGRALLSDFGLAKHSNMNGFAEPLALYDAHRPPESLLATQLTTLADIYQSGVTMYRICNGENIYLHQLRGHVNLFNAIKRSTFPDRNNYLPHIPSQLRRIINRAMHADPSKRFQSVLDFQNALSGIADTTNLDWQLNVTPQNSYHWTRETCSHIIHFTTKLYNDYFFSSSCYKTNKNSSTTRRVTSACKDFIPMSEWNTFCTEQLVRIN